MLAGEVPGEIDDVAIGDTDNSADAKGKLDLDDLDYVWSSMQEGLPLWLGNLSAGCEALLNDNVAGTNRGLFNYPGIKALNGFAKQPTTHYYRASHLYKFQVCLTWLAHVFGQDREM